MENTLISFVGYEDPNKAGLVDSIPQPGPILTILRNAKFDRIVLLSIPLIAENGIATVKAIKSEQSNIEVVLVEVPINDTTRLTDVYNRTKAALKAVEKRYHEARFSVSVASGTAQMQAALYLLASSGEFKARILDTAGSMPMTSSLPSLSFIDPLPVCQESGSLNLAASAEADIEPDVGDQSGSLTEVYQELGIVGDHPRFKKALKISSTLANHESPVLLWGETGTGKDLMARLIHRLSERRHNELIVVNCAAFSENLAESILFGHRRGSFSAAHTDQKGKFESAHGSTILLEEVYALSPRMQSRLLRYLEEGIIMPMGSDRTLKINARVIATTVRDLRDEVSRGNFREDLYYRLSAGEIQLPPLRERREDIDKLALFFLRRVNANMETPRRMTRDCLRFLRRQRWQGNVRDLKETIERAAFLSDKDTLDPTSLQAVNTTEVSTKVEVGGTPNLFHGFSIEEYLGDIRRRIILKALEMSDGNQSEASRLIGITPQAVHKFLQINRIQGFGGKRGRKKKKA